MRILLKDSAIHVGERCRITCQRTLRIPDDDKAYPLPPGLGRIPVCACADFPHFTLPEDRWVENSFFIPMFQCEALWLSFEAAKWKPNAVKVGVGGINAISGEDWDTNLRDDPQNYIVVPDQPWLDGINIGAGMIRQFVAVPLGTGQTVEAQLTGSDELGGIQLIIFEPQPGRFPDEAPPQPPTKTHPSRFTTPSGDMGLAAGGRMTQKIYPDRYGFDTWDTDNRSSLFIYIVNSKSYLELTGRKPQPTTITAATYTEFGLPWFRMYDEEYGEIEASERLKSVQSLKDFQAQENDTIDVPDSQIQAIRPPPDEDDQRSQA